MGVAKTMMSARASFSRILGHSSFFAHIAFCARENLVLNETDYFGFYLMLGELVAPHESPHFQMTP
jgi:hypothetical protein